MKECENMGHLPPELEAHWKERCISFLAIAITPHKIPYISSPTSRNSFSKELGMTPDVSDFDSVPDEPVECQPQETLSQESPEAG